MEGILITICSLLHLLVIIPTCFQSQKIVCVCVYIYTSLVLEVMTKFECHCGLKNT